MPPTRCVLLVVSVLAACGPRSGREAHTATQADGADTDGCGFLAVQAHPDPDSLIADYLRRDGAGEFTRTNAWRDTAMACPAHAPGWDGFTIISAFTLEALDRSDDQARYRVSYQRFGYLEQDSTGFHVRRDAGEERTTATLRHTASGWRIEDWDNEPHVLEQAAAGMPKVGARDRKRLEGFIPW